MEWEARSDAIVEELREANPDIIALQEVMCELYEADLQPRLASLGYAGRVQKRKDDHRTGNATFFREDRFEVGWEAHRSRVLLLGLRDLRGDRAEICVANAHLEGNPLKAMDRVSQVRSALQDASKHGGPQRHGLILCGDFNAPLISSAVASFLCFGQVLSGVSEFGHVVAPGKTQDEIGHPYAMQSAYAPDVAEFSFTLRGAAGSCHMLDHIWYDSARVQCKAVRDVFRSPEHREEVLMKGLPNAADPSDHLPVGAVLRLLPATAAEAQAESGPAELLREAHELWEACPLSQEQRDAYLACEEALSSARPSGRPTPEVLQAFEAAKQALQACVVALPADAQQMLERISELRKQARKAEQRLARQRDKDAKDAKTKAL
ncbi:CCR4 [Symbiodinium natans]|uniref:CCR4 protein n=1 Tax=Symbiodinium natans TaxID=878477 RepID=A0A812QNW6_9DINO|nr:CCR4 [Symbiodinium natans]